VVRESISEEVNLSLEVIGLTSGGYSTLTEVGLRAVFRGGNDILFGIEVLSTFCLDESDFATVSPFEECPRVDGEDSTNVSGA